MTLEVSNTVSVFIPIWPLLSFRKPLTTYLSEEGDSTGGPTHMQ